MDSFILLDCVSYGVPQNRKRVFIQGVRNDLKLEPTYPTPSHFAKEMQIPDENGIRIADIAISSFAEHGFTKEEFISKKLWWNKTMGIWMNKETAEKTVTTAIMCYGIGSMAKNMKHNQDVYNGIKALGVLA